jgi:GNAT superfamily N-acetyltransferase
MARNDFLHRQLRENLIPYKIKILSYEEAKNDIKNLIPQLYNLENQFAPGIAFYGGMLEESFNVERLELIAGLEKDAELSTLAVAYFKINSKSKEIFRKIMNKKIERNSIPIVIGYSESSLVEIPQLISMGITHYFSSSVVDYNYRGRGIGSAMHRPVLDKMDKLGTSIFVTTWISKHPSYPTPVEIWHRLGYNPLSVRKAKMIIRAIQEFQKIHGIIGRNYQIQRKRLGKIRRELNNNVISRYPDSFPIAILAEYYEPIGYNERRWDGIIMIREPKTNNFGGFRKFSNLGERTEIKTI